MKTLPFRYEVMDGKGEPMFIDFRRADPSDLDKVLALQDAIVEALPDKDLYVHRRRIPWPARTRHLYDRRVRRRSRGIFSHDP